MTFQFRYRPVIACVLALLCAKALAGITVSDAWVRGTVEGQTTTGAFMTLQSTRPVQLIAAASPIARQSALHRMTMDHDLMRMRPVPAIDIPAGRAVKLGTSGYHLMLLGLSRPLKPGGKVPLTLRFRDAAGHESTLAVQADVRPLSSDD